MPPVTKAGGSAFRKDVDFVAKDDDQQIATGIVMVPDKVDLQQDFVREETIRQFAEQFGDFAEVGQADGGVMHAVWPSEWMSLERNEVLDEATEIGGQTAPEGAWVQAWQFDDDDLWSLVADDVLSGYSIGAINVDWTGPFEPDEVDDVDTSEAPDDELVWELVDGIVREVSAVDIPAVPDAQILDTKADAEKRLADHLGNRDGFIEEAVERGHTEAEAERLWDVLNEAADVEGAGDPGSESMLGRAGKAFLNALTGGDREDDTTPPSDPPAREKEGRTLSKQNRDAVMASIDAGLDVLQDAGVDDLPKRFTDREDVDFSLDEHNARQWGGGHGDGEDPGEDGDDEDEDEDEVESAKHASGGDTPDDQTDMSDDDSPDDPMADAPEWAKTLHESVEQNSERIDDLADGGEKAAGADEEPDDPMADAPEWAKAIAEATQSNAERIDNIAKQSGVSSDQVREGDGGDDDSGLDAVGKMLS